MSGFQENLDFYLSLPRKELRSLCKTHGIPANRTYVQLAKSLASFFKKKNARTASLKDRSSSPVKSAYDVSYLAESKPKETTFSPEEATRGAFETRINSSECDSHKLASSIKRGVAADGSLCQAGSPVEICHPMDSQTRKQVVLMKAFNTEGATFPYSPHSKVTEGVCCSTSVPEIRGVRPLSTASAQENTSNTQFTVECQTAVTRSQTCHPSTRKGFSQEVFNGVAIDKGPSNTRLTPTRQQVFPESSMGSKLVSSDDRKANAVPSFQFFVSSEDGIDLYVDLNSNTPDYISSLKDDMTICQRALNQNSWAISNHIKGLADEDEHTKVSDIQAGHQNGGVARRHTNSSLSSSVSKDHHFEDYAPDRAAKVSSDPVLTTSDPPMKNADSFDGNQMISTSSRTFFSAQDQLSSDVISCTGNDKALPQDLADASYRVQTGHTSVSGGLLKPICTVDILSPSGIKNHYPSTTSVDSINAEASVLRYIPPGISDEHGSSGSQNKVETPDIKNDEKDSTPCQDTRAKVATECLGISGQHNMSANSSQPNGKPLSCGQMTKAPSDNHSPSHLLNQQIQSACEIHGNLVTKDSVLAVNTDLDGGTAVKEKRNSNANSQSSLGRGSKRPHLSAYPEFSVNRQHANSGNKRTLRSAKILGRENTPRRSTRLIK